MMDFPLFGEVKGQLFSKENRFHLNGGKYFPFEKKKVDFPPPLL